MSQYETVTRNQMLESIIEEEVPDAHHPPVVPVLAPLAPSPSYTNDKQTCAHQPMDKEVVNVLVDHSLFDALVQQLVTEHERLLRMAAAGDQRASPELSTCLLSQKRDVGALATTPAVAEDPVSPISNRDLLEVFGSKSPSSILHQHSTRKQHSQLEYEEVCGRNRSSAVIAETSPVSLIKVVNSTAFEVAFAMLIFANTAVIGIEVEYAATQLSSEPAPSLSILQHVFNGAFFVELLLRMWAYGKQFFCEPSMWAWNCFDFFVVSSAMLESIGDAVSGGSSLDVSSSNLRVIRMLRLARLIRILRASRIIRFIRALRYLVQSILFTLRSLTWAMFLLMLIIYCFAAFLTQITTDFRIQANLESSFVSESSLRDADYWWGSLGVSLNTLFMSISGGLSWHDALQPLWEIGPVATIVFYVYIAFTYFAVLNVVTGVFCQSAIESAQNDHDIMLQTVMRTKQEYKEKLQRLFTTCDTDNSGGISLDEFMQHVTDPTMRATFETLEIEMSDAKAVFAMLDVDQGGLVDIGELLEGCMRMKGLAKGVDMLRVKIDIQKTKDLVSHLLAVMETIVGNAHLKVTGKQPSKTNSIAAGEWKSGGL